MIWRRGTLNFCFYLGTRGMEISEGSRPADSGRTPFDQLHVNIPTNAHGDSMDDEFCIQTCPSRLQCSSAVRRLEHALCGCSYPAETIGQPTIDIPRAEVLPQQAAPIRPFCPRGERRSNPCRHVGCGVVSLFRCEGTGCTSGIQRPTSVPSLSAQAGCGAASSSGTQILRVRCVKVSMRRRIKRAEGHVGGVLEAVADAQSVGLCGAHYVRAILRPTRLTQCVTVHLQAPPRHARRSRLPRSDELRREPGPRVISRWLTLLRTGSWCSHAHAL